MGFSFNYLSNWCSGFWVCGDFVCGKIVNGFRLDNGIIKSAGTPEHRKQRIA